LAIFGFAAVMVDNKVDLPALGNPTNPTSAKIFNSNIIQFSRPGSPGCANCGARLILDLK
jgi:hypothetical protein